MQQGKGGMHFSTSKIVNIDKYVGNYIKLQDLSHQFIKYTIGLVLSKYLLFQYLLDNNNNTQEERVNLATIHTQYVVDPT